MLRASCLLLLVTLVSCARGAPAPHSYVAARDVWAQWPGNPVAEPQTSDIGARLATRAAGLVGLGSLKSVTTQVPDDCSGLVRYLYGTEGLDLMEPMRGTTSNASAAIWGAAKATDSVAVGTLEPGDLLFFRQTYDRDKNGRLDDGLTHVAIVESVASDGTITFIHRSGQGVNRSKMNLSLPHARTAYGGVINDFLRPKGRNWGPAFASELFAGAASAQRLQSGLQHR